MLVHGQLCRAGVLLQGMPRRVELEPLVLQPQPAHQNVAGSVVSRHCLLSDDLAVLLHLLLCPLRQRRGTPAKVIVWLRGIGLAWGRGAEDVKGKQAVHVGCLVVVDELRDQPQVLLLFYLQAEEVRGRVKP